MRALVVQGLALVSRSHLGRLESRVSFLDLGILVRGDEG